MNAKVNHDSEKKFIKKQTKPNIHKELIASEVLYRRFFETAKEGILILDAETGKIVDLNSSLIDLLGFVKKEIIKKTIWEIGCLKNIIANRDVFFELQKKESIHDDDLLLITDKGQQVYVEVVSNAYIVDEKKVIQW